MDYRLGIPLAIVALCTFSFWWTTPSERHRAQHQSAALRPRERVAPAVAVSAAPAQTARETHGSMREEPVAAVQPSGPRGLEGLDEDELMSLLNELGASDAEFSLQLVRVARARFPGSSRASERDYIEVRSLVSLGKMDDAMVQAKAFVAAYHEHPLANDVARHLLTHPMTHPTEIGRN